MLVRQNDALTRYRSETPDLWSVGSWDRLAASIINSRLPYTYSTSAEGVVLRPHDLDAAVLCSYPRDGNSMGQLCEEGTPRATPFLYRQGNLQGMLQDHERLHVTRTDDLSCLWAEGGEDPDDRSRCRYNEVVLSASGYRALLPCVIEAVFYPTNGPVHRREGNPERARRARDLFLQQHGQTSEQVPLLAFDVSLARAGHAPFSLAV